MRQRIRRLFFAFFRVRQVVSARASRSVARGGAVPRSVAHGVSKWASRPRKKGCYTGTMSVNWLPKPATRWMPQFTKPLRGMRSGGTKREHEYGAEVQMQDPAGSPSRIGRALRRARWHLAPGCRRRGGPRRRRSGIPRLALVLNPMDQRAMSLTDTFLSRGRFVIANHLAGATLPVN